MKSEARELRGEERSSLSMLDFSLKSSSLSGLVNPGSKDEARDAGEVFDRVRFAEAERAVEPINSTLSTIRSQVQQAASNARTRDELRTMVESAVEGGRPLYRNVIEEQAQRIGRSLHERVTDLLDDQEKSHYHYVNRQKHYPTKQTEPPETDPTAPPPEGQVTPEEGAPIGTAIALFIAASIGSLIDAPQNKTIEVVIGLLNQSIREAEEEGLSLSETIERFVGLLDDSPWFKQSRAQRIARTLATRVSNWAGLRAAREHSTDWMKDWVSQRDAVVRRTHLDTDFSGPIGLDEFFEVGGFQAQFPSDPRLPPKELINCRCFLIFVTS